MKFNNSKKAVLKRQELKQYSDKKIEDIVYSIKITPIFDYDIQIIHKLINECFQDLQINKSMYNAAMYLEEIGKYLDYEKLDKLLNEEYLVYFARKEVEEKIKNFYGDGALLAIAKEYAPYVKNNQELSVFISQIKYDAMTKTYILLKEHVFEQVESIYKNYKDLFDLRTQLIYEIDRVFKIDRKKWLESNAEEILEHTERYRDIFSFREMEKLALDNGFILDRINGSHHIYKKDDKTIVIPRHNKDLGKGIASKIQKNIRKNEE